MPPEMAGLLARPSRAMTAADDPVKLVHQSKHEANICSLLRPYRIRMNRAEYSG